MDAGESGTSRQRLVLHPSRTGWTQVNCKLPSYSGFTSYSRPETFSHYSRDSAEKQSRERPPNMAAVALMSSAPAYHPHHQSYPQSYSQQSPAPMPGILTPAEPPRRVSKDSEPAQRQSLPSISEMFNAKPSGFPPTTPTTAAGPSHLPPPPPPPVFHQNVPPPPAPRPEPSAESRSQPPLFTQRPDNGPPGTAYQYGESREPSRPVDLHRNGSFSGSHAPPVAYPGPSQLPPGQLPLSQAPPPISPRHPMPPQFETQRPPMHSDEEVGAPRRYDSNNLNQQFEVWGYTDCLQRVSF